MSGSIYSTGRLSTGKLSTGKLSNLVRSVVLPACVLPLILPVQAGAQEGAAPEEVIVTARKRDENVMDIPDSITVFNDRVIETANIASIRDFADMTPNLTIIDQLRPGTQTMTIRGMTTVQNGELPVAFVVDGVNVPSMNFINQELVDIERIEVLRGPQGTLYGRGAVGGAISIVTKEPGEQFEGKARVTYGRGNSLFAGGTLSGALSDSVSLRVSASHRDEDGLIDNEGAGTEADFVDEQSVQARLTVRPSEQLSFDFRARFLQGESGGIYLVPVTTETIDDFSIPVSSNINGGDDRDVSSFSVKIDRTFDNGVTLTSISGYHETDSFFFGDGDFSTDATFAQNWEIDVEAFNQELRLTSDGDGRLRWIAGAFYQDREDKEFTDFGTEAPGPSIGFAFPGGAREIRERRSWAVFGQVDYDISGALTLSAGLRFDEEDNETEFGQLGVTPSESFDEWQPKVSLTYDWREGVMSYVTLARGFRPGGFSNTSGVLYDNEVSDNFEIGTKASIFGNRVQLNAAIFYIDFSDQQFFFSRVTQAGVQRFITNIDETTNVGGELEVAIRATDKLDLNFAYAVTDTEIDDFDGTGQFNGNDTPQVNDFSFNASAEYTTPISSALDLVARLDYEHRGEVDWDLNNLVTTPGKDYLNFHLEIAGENWAAFVFGRNILDEQQPTAIGTDVFGPGIHLRTPSRPAFYGVGFKTAF